MTQSNRHSLSVDQLKKNARRLHVQHPGWALAQAQETAAQDAGFAHWHEALAFARANDARLNAPTGVGRLTERQLAKIIRLAYACREKHGHDTDAGGVRYAHSDTPEHTALEDALRAVPQDSWGALVALYRLGSGYDAGPYQVLVDEANRDITVHVPAYLGGLVNLGSGLEEGRRLLHTEPDGRHLVAELLRVDRPHLELLWELARCEQPAVRNDAEKLLRALRESMQKARGGALRLLDELSDHALRILIAYGQTLGWKDVDAFGYADRRYFRAGLFANGWLPRAGQYIVQQRNRTSRGWVPAFKDERYSDLRIALEALDQARYLQRTHLEPRESSDGVKSDGSDFRLVDLGTGSVLWQENAETGKERGREQALAASRPYLTHNDDRDRAAQSGGAKVGTIEADYALLVRSFGVPAPTATYKIKANWYVRFPDGAIAHIYDWQSAVSPRRNRFWNVAGEDPALARRVTDAINLNR